MQITKEQQTRKNRIKPKNKNFSPKVKQEIFERDNYQCVRCGTFKNLENVPHHIQFKSQGGNGSKRNGATVCIDCHRKAHRSDEVRRWFEEWRDKYLDKNGDKYA